MVEWMLAPCDPARLHDVGVQLSWHARSMVAAWSVLVPLGVIAARFLKVFPGQDWPRELDDRRWWHAHRAAQYMALMLMLTGLFMVLFRPVAATSITKGVWIHHLFGWTTLALGCSQYLAGWLRGTKGGPSAPALDDGSWRGDHYDMTGRRRLFERFHKSVGYVAILMSAVAIASGLWQANAPRWMFAFISTWYLVLTVVFALLQRRGMARDTYQAIWGPEPQHPGNSRRPIGIGIKRTSSETE